jgi:hypothetical protein
MHSVTAFWRAQFANRAMSWPQDLLIVHNSIFLLKQLPITIKSGLADTPMITVDDAEQCRHQSILVLPSLVSQSFRARQQPPPWSASHVC